MTKDSRFKFATHITPSVSEPIKDAKGDPVLNAHGKPKMRNVRRDVPKDRERWGAPKYAHHRISYAFVVDDATAKVMRNLEEEVAAEFGRWYVGNQSKGIFYSQVGALLFKSAEEERKDAAEAKERRAGKSPAHGAPYKMGRDFREGRMPIREGFDAWWRTAGPTAFTSFEDSRLFREAVFKIVCETYADPD